MQPGSIVICVDGSNWRSDATEKLSSLPVKGQIYTVRKMIPSTLAPGYPDGVFIEGITGQIVDYTNYEGQTDSCECHFRQSRFAELLPPLSFSIEEEEALLDEEVVLL